MIPISGNEVVGIDPGAKYTAVSVIDGEEVVMSSTYVRPDDMEPITWGVVVTNYIIRDIISLYPHAPIGIEGVTPPGAHLNGKLNLMNPKHLIRLSFVVGSLAFAFPNAAIVKARKNGKGEIYPASLTGRRPKTLAGLGGAGTRNHERSAYDVAQKVKGLLKDGYKLDMIKNLFDE